MAVVLDHSDRVKLSRLIEDATSSVDPQLNPSLIRAIKYVVRSSEATVHLAHELLLYRLKKNHSQVRYLAVLIVDQLFTRSKLFRTLLVSELENYMHLTIGYRAEHVLPPPSEQATALRKKSLELLQKWNGMFGQHYRQLRLGYEYLKKTIKLQFPDGVEQDAAQAQRHRREREERTQELLNLKFGALQAEFPDARAEIRSTLDQIQQCFQLLVKQEQLPPGDDTGADGAGQLEFDPDSDEEGAYGVRDLRRMVRERAAEPSASGEAPPEAARETQDNEAVFDTLRELYRLLRTRHVTSAQDWLSILMRVDPPDRRPRDVLLKEVIDIRSELLRVQEKCEALGVHEPVHADMDDMDDVVWEAGNTTTSGSGVGNNATDGKVGEKLPGEEVVGSAPGADKLCIGEKKRERNLSTTSVAGAPGVVDPSRATSSLGASSSNSSSGRKPGAGKPGDDDNRDELLKSAPVLPWGAYLDAWGAESAVPANQRGLLLENHWGKVDYDVCIPADKVAQLSMRASVFEPEKQEIRPCLAPLRKGGLCQRRDLHTCPLHGRIVPRDADGNPTTMQEERQLETASAVHACAGAGDGDTGNNHDVLVSVARQAIDNVRGKDKIDEKLKRKQLARSQAQRDREHNEAVLRTAAISQSVQGLNEVVGEPAAPESSTLTPGKRKSPSLASMLRKKPTSKDRLARRLLNGRVRDTSVAQQIRDQEANYREAFANQW